MFAQLNTASSSQNATAERSRVNTSLSERETEVVRLLGKGKNNKEIAQALHLSQGTVRNHISRILSELGLRDRTQAALWAQKHL